MSAEQRILDAALRTDFMTFVHRSMLTLNPGINFLRNWHLDAIAWHLQRVMAGEIKRLIINMPPRSLKSQMVSVALPAFWLGHQPRQKIFGISYGSDLAAKHAGDFRALVESRWYRQTFRNMRVARAIDSDVYTTERGFRKATSIHSTLTGLGGDCLIIDDPLKPVDAQSDSLRNGLNDWFSSTLLSRLDDKTNGIIIVVMQRVHLHDLTGYLLERSKNDWVVLSLPAIAETHEEIQTGPGTFKRRLPGEALHPEREPVPVLEGLRRELGSDIFAAQYQQAPVPPGGAMIKRDWLRYYDRAPERTARSTIIQSWDTASKEGAQNDWSVCTTWLVLDRVYYLIDLVRGRFAYPRLKAAALAQAEKHKPRHILVEDSSIGTALGQELKTIHLSGAVRLVRPDRDKEGRLYVNEAKFESGLVQFPRSAPFLPELETELLSFPQSKHDDQVDSITQALSYPLSTYTLQNVS